MMNSIESDLSYLTDTLTSKVETRVLLRPSLEAALFRMGYNEAQIDTSLDQYYDTLRTVH